MKNTRKPGDESIQKYSGNSLGLKYEVLKKRKRKKKQKPRTCKANFKIDQARIIFKDTNLFFLFASSFFRFVVNEIQLNETKKN